MLIFVECQVAVVVVEVRQLVVVELVILVVVGEVVQLVVVELMIIEVVIVGMIDSGSCNDTQVQLVGCGISDSCS